MEYKPFKMKATAAGYSTPFQKNFGIGMPEGGVGSPMQFDLKGMWSKAKEYASPENLDKTQLALTGMGMTPGGGIAADAANTIISLARGKWGEAASNALMMIPGLGQVVAGGKLARGAFREGARIAGKFDKHTDVYSKASGTKDIVEGIIEHAGVGKKDSNKMAAVSTNELKNKGVTKLPTNKKKTYKEAWASMPAEMKKRYNNFKDFENQAMAWNKRKQTLKT